MIRKMKNSELDDVMRVWLQAAIQGHPFISEAYWKENEAIVRKQYIPLSDTYVYAEQKIQGFISIIENKWIGALFVAPQFESKGVGGQLVKFAQKRFEHLQLAVYQKNKKAFRFYLHHGFKVEKIQPNKKTNEEEYVMKWEKKQANERSGL